MKIRIDTPIAKLTADLTEEQVAEILARTLDYAVGSNSHVPPEPKPVVVTVPLHPPLPVRTPKTTDSPKLKFQGFLYIQCEECGQFKGFMPKTPLTDYRCDCGHTTPLHDARVMRVDCKCGQKFKYLTNTKENIVTIDCYNCGSPVDLEFHERKQEYTTI